MLVFNYLHKMSTHNSFERENSTRMPQRSMAWCVKFLLTIYGGCFDEFSHIPYQFHRWTCLIASTRISCDVYFEMRPIENIERNRKYLEYRRTHKKEAYYFHINIIIIQVTRWLSLEFSRGCWLSQIYCEFNPRHPIFISIRIPNFLYFMVSIMQNLLLFYIFFMDTY